MAQVLETIIAINAQVGNGFSAVGTQLTQLGSLVNGTSQMLLDFGKESVEVYKDYEKSMADAEVALSTIYGRNTSELSGVMNQLDAAATEWAASTIFHTNDVGNAISDAAHAGWDLEKIMAGIPAAMELAQAGGLDLSEAVNYIVKSTNAAGIEFEDIGNFIDHWTFAANSSATNIDELGSAMLRMGGTMKFADNTDELLTMLAVTADAGYTGQEAGTLLRNSMLRLIAPTKKAREAMEELGATSDETSEIMNDEALAAANARLEATGFSAYDEYGDLKGMLDTYRDLYVALGEIAGGYDKITENEESLNILSAIFPTRSITGALTLLEAASTGYKGLYEELQDGAAEGYGEYAAGVEMDTLFGKTETFESKLERLKQLVGEELAPGLENAMEFAGGIVDSIAQLDEGTFGALVNGLEVVALAGPGLLTAGGAIRLIGTVIGSQAAAIGMGAIAVAALVSGLSSLAEAEFEDKFGELELDQSAIISYTEGLRENFDNARATVEELNKQLSAIETSYTNATSALSSGLLQAAILGNKLSDTEIDDLKEYGKSIGDALKEGLDVSFSETYSSLNAAFTGSEDAGAVGDGVWTRIVAVLNQDYQEKLNEMTNLSQQLRDAMTSAFADNELTPQERENIQSILTQMDDAFAENLSIKRAGERARALHKVRTLGLGSYTEALGVMRDELDSQVEELEVEQAEVYERARIDYEKAVKEGTMYTDPETGKQKRVTSETMESDLATLKANQEARTEYFRAMNLPAMMELTNSLFTGSDLEDQFKALNTLADSISRNGGIATEGARGEFESNVTQAEAGDLQEIVSPLVEMMGGADTLNNTIEYLRSTGKESDAALAAQIEGFSLASQVLDLYSSGHLDEAEYSSYTRPQDDDGGRAALQGYLDNLGLTAENLVSLISEGHFTPGNANMEPIIAMEQTASSYGFEESQVGVQAWIESIIPPEETLEVPVEGQVDEVQLPEEEETMEITATVVNASNMDELQTGVITMEAEANSVTADVEGNTEPLGAAIEQENGKQLTEIVDGDTAQLAAAIDAEDGRTLTAYIDADPSPLESIYNSYNGRTITFNVVTAGAPSTGGGTFAEGGRADQPSIFGEAGPEWAIPEEHTENTRSLLAQAAEASGFSLLDIAGASGGGSSSGSESESSSTTIVYSPTINAANVDGVEKALGDDKKQFVKYMKEKLMFDKMEVYT